MSKRVLTALAALSMAWATSALAETAPPNGSMSQPGFHHRIQDPVAWHKEKCVDHYARRAGRLAFLEAKLNLTDAQKGPWNAWRQAELDDAAKMRDACLANLPANPGTPPTILEREARIEKMMGARLAAMQSSRPALESLYAVLTPDQKAVLDHMAMGHRHGWHRHGMMMDHPRGD